MNLADIGNILGLLLGVVSLAYAIYQGTERKKLEKFSRSQAWYIYAKANNSNGIVQHAFGRYKADHSTDLNPELVELLAKADAFGQDLFKECIRQIQITEPQFDGASIEKWISEGKVDADFKPLFRQLAIENQ